ncbi:MAG: hypothetical protein A3G24_18840 [Betaproteobacteria bacterium RIFCSPLOWO2_12_FULL_62_13]|nr:MAG: hypothetical protein A3G24_18840 [Betaproteobacteria bacterium RIFCSPLOWO2_12_FULL_62_13]
MLAYWLFGLALVLAIAYMVWAYRKKAAAQAAARSERFEQIFGSTSCRVAALDPAARAAEVSTPQPSVTPGSSRAPQRYARKKRLLGQAHALLLSTLRSALPEHEVFAHVSLAAVIEIPQRIQGREREQRAHALAQHTFDCVVCSKEMQVIVVVDLEAGNSAQIRFKSECLKEAGVRYMRADPVELPPHEQIGALLLGARDFSGDPFGSAAS